jgi:hypothetical protein
MNLKEGLDQWSMNNDPKYQQETNYTYDHIARRLLNDHAWIRVPWYVAHRDTHPPQRNYGPDLISKLNELEERIKSK